MYNSKNFIVNPIANIEWKDNNYIISVPTKRKKFEISPDLLEFLFHFHHNEYNLDPEECLIKHLNVSPEVANKAVCQLQECEVLIRKQDSSSSYNLWIKNGWRHALVFHLATKDLSFADECKQSSDEQRKKLTLNYLKEEIPAFSKDIGNYTDLPPASNATASFGRALRKRRTCRSFGDKPTTLEQISTVLYYGSYDAAKIRSTARNCIEDDSRFLLHSTYTSFEIYFIALNVQDLPNGVYHYQLERHQISLVRSGRFNKEIRHVAIGQNVENCSAVFIITSCFKRYMYRYRNSRAFRNILIESGSLCHKLLLAAEAQGLKTFLTPALRDKFTEEVFELEPNSEYPLYLLGVGYGKTRNTNSNTGDTSGSKISN